MKARAELEIYRRFTGALRGHPLRFWPIVVANVRVACKKKRALFFFYVPPAIAMIVGCFLVYAKFAVEGAMEQGDFGAGPPIQELLAMQATQLLEVRNQIYQILVVLIGFSLLASVWFGSGLLCEDRRAGAHLLYFTRPLTRLDYFAGKFLTAAFFSGAVVFVPGIVICVFATFTSPEWSFLKQEWDLFFRVTAYALVWVAGVGSITLCVSSLASRRVFALIGAFAFFMLSQGVAQVLGHLVDERFKLLSPLDNLEVIARSLFKQFVGQDEPPLAAVWAALAATVALALLVVARRIRRWEVVG